MKSPARSNLLFGLLVTSLVASLGVGLAGVAALQSTTRAGDALPRFFAWSGPEVIEGRFLVMFEPDPVAIDGRLIEDDGHLYVNPTAGSVDSAGVADIEHAIEGGALATVDATLAGLVADHRVESVEPLGFDTYLVTGGIALSELADLPGVIEVVADVGLSAASADEYFPLQWPLENIGAETTFATAFDADIDGPRAWHRARGAGMTVAVLDSGIDTDHPDLAGSIWTNPGEVCGNGVDDDANGYVDDCRGWNFGAGTGDIEDRVGHGTHVSGIIAADADNGAGIAGVAYEATIMPLKVGDSPTLSAAVEAFAYAINNGARVINVSWVTPDPNARVVLERAIAGVARAGVLVVAGAGNDSRDLGTNPVYPAAIDAPNMITVAATTALDELATFSNMGASVDIGAPGAHVISTVPGGYAVYSGTSMAAPHVAAAAALLWSAEPTAGVDDVVAAIIDRADHPASLARSVPSGRLDVGAGVEARKFAPSLGFTFIGFDSFEPNEPHDVAVRAALTDPWIAPPQTSARYRVAVLAAGQTAPMAVSGLPIGTSGGVVTTDDTGRAFVGEAFVRARRPALVQGRDVTDLSLRLPTGTYALVFELVDVSDKTSPKTLGDPSAVFFIVGLDVDAIPFPIDMAPAVDSQGENVGEAVEPESSTTPSSAADGTGGGADPSAGDPVAEPGADVANGGPGVVDEESDTTAVDPSVGPAGSGQSTPSVSTPAIPPTAGSTNDIPPTNGGTEHADGGSPDANEDPSDPSQVSFGLVRVHPDAGSSLGGTTVTIVGEIPAHPVIQFGSAMARLVTTGDGYAVVETTAHEAAVVDVVVVDFATGDRGVLAAAYTYSDEQAGGDVLDDTNQEDEADGGALGATGPSGGSAGGAVPIGPNESVSTGDVGGDPATPGPAAPTIPDVPEAPSPEVDGPDVGSAAGDFGGWLASALVTPEGLDLVPLAADDPLARLNLLALAGQRCTSPECPGWVLAPGVHHATDPRTADHQNGSGKSETGRKKP